VRLLLHQRHRAIAWRWLDTGHVCALPRSTWPQKRQRGLTDAEPGTTWRCRVCRTLWVARGHLEPHALWDDALTPVTGVRWHRAGWMLRLRHLPALARDTWKATTR
jgi:hypothetical protein